MVLKKNVPFLSTLRGKANSAGQFSPKPAELQKAGLMIKSHRVVCCSANRTEKVNGEHKLISKLLPPHPSATATGTIWRQHLLLFDIVCHLLKEAVRPYFTGVSSIFVIVKIIVHFIVVNTLTSYQSHCLCLLSACLNCQYPASLCATNSIIVFISLKQSLP